jgi:hypothetical protein
VDDPFYIDLGAAFDSLNFRMGVGGVLPPAEDADDTHNYAPDAVADFNVNSIVLEVPALRNYRQRSAERRRSNESADLDRFHRSPPFCDRPFAPASTAIWLTVGECRVP